MKALSILLLLAVVKSRIAASYDAKLFKQTFGAQCPSSWERFGRYCYLVSGCILTWDQARSYCTARGGDLVKINSARENEFVLNLVQQRQPSLRQIWINLKWDSSVKQFLWNDHSIPVYTNWAAHEPNGKASEPCGNIWIGHQGSLNSASGSWNDLPCGKSQSFPCGLVCKRLP
ncbi:snaclec coagulation factor IX-binding protein subunit A-like isoform X1 [Montipora capricornis]|uniref:snaclec coagulation factor IX-binding protein subunit A-like isoform X1 n=1 Tax=Montipora capricornis TaxID=246305 RepID=UPI0035F11F30